MQDNLIGTRNSMVNDIAVIVASFDGYADIWPIFFECKERYWNDCPFKTYLITNNLDYKNDCCIAIKTGEETNWCDRILNALQMVNERTVIFLLEDYLIGEDIRNEIIKQYIDQFNMQKMKYLRLIDFPRKRGKGNKSNIFEIYSNEEYGINLQPAIWDKSYLESILKEIGGGRSAWEFEIYLLSQCTKDAHFMDGCFATKDNILNIHNGVLKGKWFKKEIKFFKKRGILIEPTDRKILSTGEYMNYFLRITIREHISPSLRKQIKRVLMKLGVKFVSDI